MEKPQVGDVIKMKNPEESIGLSFTTHADVRVIAVHDSLDENWDPFGESAWAQRDHDEATGQTGEWYVICELVGDPDGTFSLGSYEVA